MPSDAITQIAGLEPTYLAREAAALLSRSYSWLDQRLRQGEFVRPDGAVVQPLRTPGRYRRFTLEMPKDIALSRRSLADRRLKAARGWGHLSGCPDAAGPAASVTPNRRLSRSVSAEVR